MTKKLVLCLFLGLIVGLFPLIARYELEETVDIPKLTNSPKIDGILDNPLWENQALKIEDFLQFAPK
jgi:hypothetical protein